MNILKALGAEIIRTPTEAAWDSPESHISVALRLNRETPNSHILDQYANPSNPLAHYDTTAEEILEQCGGKLDAIVAGAGTGGTITGLARKLKEKLPNLIVVGVDPVGSILAQPESLNDGTTAPYHVEGIGYDFIPTVLDRQIIDKWYKCEDQTSLTMARRLIKEEGLLCGGSSGAAMHAAVEFAKTMPEGSRVVVILPDSVRNYMSKFLADEWMVENGFIKTNLAEKPAWHDKPVSALDLPSPVTVQPDVTVKDTLHTMSTKGYDQLPVVEANGNVVGVVSLGNLTSCVTRGRVTPTGGISCAIYKKFKKVTPSTTLEELARIFDREPYAIVVNPENNTISAVVTRIDLLNFISK